MATDWDQKLKSTFQPHVPEPIQAVGILQPPGTWGSFGLGRISPLASMITAKTATKKAGGLAKTGAFSSAKMCGVVLTPGQIYAFRVKPKGQGWKIEEQLGVWDRNDVKVTVTPRKLTNLVEFDVAGSGEHYELEATTVGTKGFHDPFFAELAKR